MSEDCDGSIKIDDFADQAVMPYQQGWATLRVCQNLKVSFSSKLSRPETIRTYCYAEIQLAYARAG